MHGLYGEPLRIACITLVLLDFPDGTAFRAILSIGGGAISQVTVHLWSLCLLEALDPPAWSIAFWSRLRGRRKEVLGASSPQ